MKSGIFSKAFQSIRLTKRQYDPGIIEINDVELPSIYKDFDDSRIIRDIKSELQTYKSLGYRFKDQSQLQNKDYYSFQIGLLFTALNRDIDLKISKPKDYLPDFIISSRAEYIRKEISSILKKFNAQVSKDISEIIAKDEFIWTPEEAGYILYYLSISKNLK